ncbi:1-phosphofructokinase family hexose kinase [Conexibacter sp. CPCC 206217]|uniref:1-phosphofructokinase family hexose kinase n=1 Tax=Conexibacter sp. CPCC 206217 TaxID=3064574 RepID=UPI00271CE68F|nr:1-phosphofructokinase family hexose kinase [Conexibacter sp. CPCC 206217]MDO8213572.1 1-phosphofructokinase family hexose kinase [Conexibacter sp. CPCC 206217]
MKTIVTLTLNPALDVTTSVADVVPAIKLRCGPERLDPGGGGLNAARTIAALGGHALAVHCSGGNVGRRLQRLLDVGRVPQQAIPIEGETRESFAVHDQASGQQYRFVLPGPTLSPAEWRRAFAATVEAAAGSPGALVLASGSLPPGVPADGYARLARAVRGAGARFVLDTNGPALEAALRAGVHLIKPNWREFDALAGHGRAVTDDERRALAAEIVGSGGAEVVVVTLGERGALVTCADAQFEIRPPRVDVVSAVGGGDAFAGALLLALARGWPLEAACRYGVAAAAAAVGTPGTAPPARAAVERLHRAVGDHPRWRSSTGAAPRCSWSAR